MAIGAALWATPVKPFASRPPLGNADAGNPRSVTCCTPLASGAEKVMRKLRLGSPTVPSALNVLKILKSKIKLESNVVGVPPTDPANGPTVRARTVLLLFRGD